MARGGVEDGRGRGYDLGDGREVARDALGGAGGDAVLDFAVVARIMSAE
jgi:hypothetical protein